MGDIGALSLGAALALMSILAKQEILLLVAGGLFCHRNGVRYFTSMVIQTSR